MNVEFQPSTKKRKLNTQNLLAIVEHKHYRLNLEKKERSMKNTIKTGDIIRVAYKIPEGEKERIQYYEGLIIAQRNHNISQTFTLRRIVQGIGVEQVFLFNSPKILSITKKQSSKIRRSKLYYIRKLSGKATRLKRLG